MEYFISGSIQNFMKIEWSFFFHSLILAQKENDIDENDWWKKF